MHAPDEAAPATCLTTLSCLAVFGAQLLMNDTSFLYNNGQLDGGALHFEGCMYMPWAMNNITLVGNTAPDGGGINLDASAVTFTNSLMAANVASLYSGAVLVYMAAMTLINSQVIGNR